MKRSILPILGILALFLIIGCRTADTAENRDRAIVDHQQTIYQGSQPVHIFDFSIPRDIYQQIYDITTTEVVATYSVIESITGVTKYQCPSIGYAIPADRSLTNPLQGAYKVDQAGADEFSVVLEQPEPDGLFSSKNTDATWILCVDLVTGEAYPFYTEHKVMTWPFIVKQNEESDEWVRADNSPITFTVEIRETAKDSSPPTVP